MAKIFSLIKNGRRVDIEQHEFLKMVNAAGEQLAKGGAGSGRYPKGSGEEKEAAPKEAKETKADEDTQHFLDVGWDADSDVERIKEAGGVDKFLEKENAEHVKMQERDGFKSAITFENKEQAILWSQEITGQLSDGVWENDDKMGATIGGVENWWFYNAATTTIGKEPSFAAEKDGEKAYLYTPDLKEGLYENEELVGRMIRLVRESGANPNYTKANLDKDIDSIQRAISRGQR